jgi:predicted Zn-dependent protease
LRVLAARVEKLAALAVILACGCASAPPPPAAPPPLHQSGPAGFEPLPGEAELWVEAARDAEAVEQTGLLLADEHASSYLAKVLDSLCSGLELPEGVPAPSAQIVRSSAALASTSPDGRIYVSLGLLVRMDSEDQLAAVLAHELAHFLLRHSAQDRRYQALTRSTVARMRFSRQEERAADRLGMDLMQEAGYSLSGMHAALRVLAAETVRPPYRVLAWESHPDIAARIKASAKRARSEVPPDEDADSRSRRYFDGLGETAWSAGIELLLEDGALDDAHEMLQRDLRVHPESGPAHYLSARYLRLTSDEGRSDPRVREQLERARELAPQDPEILRELGLLLRDLGEHELAREYLAHYLDLRADAPDRAIVERYLAE